MESSLKVGASKVCINPTPDMYPIPSSFSDWGKAPQLQEGIYDDMYCRAIAIDNGQEKTVIMTWDTIGYPGHPTLRKLLSDTFDIPENNFLICATHNHSAAKDYHSETRNNSPAEIAFHEKYWQIEESAALLACREALSSMKPAKYGYGETESYINVNRDVQTPFGYWIEGKNLGGFSDRTLAVVKFTDMDDGLICAFVNYPMHNTCLHMMKDADGKAKTSANVSGVACKYAEEHYGNGAVIAWSSGAAGNQNPLFSHNLQYEYSDGYSTSVPLPDGVGFMMMEYCGRLHGADIVKGIDAVGDCSCVMPMSHVFHEIQLPAQKRADGKTTMEPIRMGGNTVRPDTMGVGDFPPVPPVPEMLPDPDSSVPLQMQLHMLGDIAFVGVNAEPYCEIGCEMKKASPYKKTVIVTHCDEMLKGAGYIMDKGTAARNAKVFQAFGKVRAGGCEEAMIAGERCMFEQLMCHK